MANEWACVRCTFLNGHNALACDMCASPKPAAAPALRIAETSKVGVTAVGLPAVHVCERQQRRRMWRVLITQACRRDGTGRNRGCCWACGRGRAVGMNSVHLLERQRRLRM
eukprot:g10532.t1